MVVEHRYPAWIFQLKVNVEIEQYFLTYRCLFSYNRAVFSLFIDVGRVMFHHQVFKDSYRLKR